MRKPSLAASSAVARTQWSVAMPTTSTSSMWRERSHSANGTPFSSVPSKPLYAAEYAPFSNTASTAPEATAGAKFGWKPTPSVPATQCAGQVRT